MTLRALLLCAAAYGVMIVPANAEQAPWGEGVDVVSDVDLSALRGGFAINGIEINFGAVVTTYVNGVPALTTNLTWTDMGTFIEETVGGIGQSLEEMTPEELAALGLDGLENVGGVVIDDDDGVTALVHNVTEGSLQNIIINSATGRDLSQEIDVTLELPGFDIIQGQLVVERFGIQIADDLRGVAFYDPGG